MSWIWSRRSCWIQLGSEGPQADNGLVELWFCGGETSAFRRSAVIARVKDLHHGAADPSRLCRAVVLVLLGSLWMC